MIKSCIFVITHFIDGTINRWTIGGFLIAGSFPSRRPGAKKVTLFF